MSEPLRITQSVSFAGISVDGRETVIDGDGAITKRVSVAPAKTGTLTTRTNTTVGTLTMSASHGIATGNRLDIYWDGGSRRGVVVGTVSVNSVPFSLGDGDDLPSAQTAITAAVPVEEAIVVDSDDVTGIVLYSSQDGTIVIAQSDNTELMAFMKGGSSKDDDRLYVWHAGRSSHNPLSDSGETANSVAKAFLSHSDSSATATMIVAFQYV